MFAAFPPWPNSSARCASTPSPCCAAAQLAQLLGIAAESGKACWAASTAASTSGSEPAETSAIGCSSIGEISGNADSDATRLAADPVPSVHFHALDRRSGHPRPCLLLGSGPWRSAAIDVPQAGPAIVRAQTYLSSIDWSSPGKPG